MIENSLVELATGLGAIAISAYVLLVMARKQTDPKVIDLATQTMNLFGEFRDIMRTVGATMTENVVALKALTAHWETDQTANQAAHKTALELMQKMDTTLTTQTENTQLSSKDLNNIHLEVQTIKIIVTKLLEVVTRLEVDAKDKATTLQQTRQSIEEVRDRVKDMETKLAQNGNIPKPETILADNQESIPKGN